MTTEQFFEKFELFAGAPDAIPRLRQLILELAVRGQLTAPTQPSTPTNPSAPSAKPLNDSRYTSAWPTILLSDALKNRSGNSKLIKGKLHDAPAPHLYQGFSASGPDVWCETFEHEGEAIIVSAVGARCGKAFKATGKWSAIANTNIVRPDPNFFDFDFAFLVLNDEAFWMRGGSAQPFVKFPPSLNRYFALPPLAEQKRIVAKVDELMALCDQLEAQQQEREAKHAALSTASLARFAEAPTPANLNFLFHHTYDISPADLRKTILTLAVQGKLVLQDPSDEPVPSILMLGEKTELLATTMGLRPTKNISNCADEPHEVPPTWIWTTLGLLGAAQTGSTPSKGDAKAFNGDIPFVKPADITLGAVDYSNESLSEHGARTGSRLAPAGSLLMVCIGTIGKCNLIDRECAFNQQINSLTPIENVDSRYLLSVARCDYFQRLAWSKSSSTTIAILNKGKWLTIPAPLPPLAEQKRIVAKVDELMALVDQLEEQLASSRTLAAQLTEAVVAELTAAA